MFNDLQARGIGRGLLPGSKVRTIDYKIKKTFSNNALLSLGGYVTQKIETNSLVYLWAGPSKNIYCIDRETFSTVFYVSTTASSYGFYILNGILYVVDYSNLYKYNAITGSSLGSTSFTPQYVDSTNHNRLVLVPENNVFYSLYNKYIYKRNALTGEVISSYNTGMFTNEIIRSSIDPNIILIVTSTNSVKPYFLDSDTAGSLVTMTFQIANLLQPLVEDENFNYIINGGSTIQKYNRDFTSMVSSFTFGNALRCVYLTSKGLLMVVENVTGNVSLLDTSLNVINVDVTLGAYANYFIIETKDGYLIGLENTSYWVNRIVNYYEIL